MNELDNNSLTVKCNNLQYNNVDYMGRYCCLTSYYATEQSMHVKYLPSG